MAKVLGAVEINKERCKGCDLCVVACPCDVLSLQPEEVNDRGYHYAFAAAADKCIGCAACATVCPDSCITVYRVVER
ncbi:MAG TPA: ferredoxin [Porphyromonadaceae bacterium]|nr:ferredoxin [Porphyromonadaceae bacterium]